MADAGAAEAAGAGAARAVGVAAATGVEDAGAVRAAGAARAAEGVAEGVPNVTNKTAQQHGSISPSCPKSEGA